VGSGREREAEKIESRRGEWVKRKRVKLEEHGEIRTLWYHAY